jgi:DNA topoisomerase-1
VRLRRSDPSGPGYSRVRVDRGFSYLTPGGERLEDPDELARIRGLTIPPAWEQVWICIDPLGHLQATGVDAAGRKQYLYHEQWREQQDHKKFAHMMQFAGTLPPMREQLLGVLGSGHELDRARVLACSVRLLDVGLFRIGSEQYERLDGHLGLATVAKANVAISGEEAVFDYIAKEGVHQVHAVRDPLCVEVVGALKRRRGGGEHLLAFREDGRWHQVHSHQINDHIKGLIGEHFSAKDFRTWNATMLAAVSVASNDRDTATPGARKRVIDGAVRRVAEVLGDTTAVTRRSYIDPRVFDRYRCGATIRSELDRIGELSVSDDAGRARLEHAVLELLSGDCYCQ